MLVFTLLCSVVAALWIAIQQKAALIEKDAVIAVPRMRSWAMPTTRARRRSKAVDDATVWLHAEITKVYANVSDDELDSAVRWIVYAQLESPFRSCS